MSLPDTDEAIRAAVRPWRKEPIYIHPELRAVWNAAIDMAAYTCETLATEHGKIACRECGRAILQTLRDKT